MYPCINYIAKQNQIPFISSPPPNNSPFYKSIIYNNYLNIGAIDNNILCYDNSVRQRASCF